jgi:hypothetical protein
MSNPQIFWYATESLKAITPIAIGLFAAWIALRQWRVQRLKLKLDLFDRRMRVYVATLDAVKSLVDDPKGSNEAYFDLVRATGDSEFLFEKPILEFLSSVLKDVREHRSLNRRIERAGETNDLDRLSALDLEQNQVEINLEKKMAIVRDHFRPYLDFRDVR